VTNATHRTAGGLLPDALTNSADQISLFAFLETIDTKTVPFVTLDIRRSGNQIIVGFDSVQGVSYSIEGRTNLNASPGVLTNVTGIGQHLDVPLPNTGQARFIRLLSP